MSLKQLILKDERVVKVIKRLKKTNIDVTHMFEDISRMHSSRKIRALDKSKVLANSQMSLIDSNLSDASYRSNLVSMKLNILKEVMEKNQLLKDVNNYILAKHAKTLKKYHSTLSGQKNYVSVLFSTYSQSIADMDNIIKLIDIVIEDIDSSGWTLKRVQEVLHELKQEKFR